jgi:hypothetical protein
MAVGVRDLRQRLVQHGDVVRSGVRPGVARSEQTRQRFTGRVEKAQQRVVAPRLLPGLGSLFLLRVAEHDRGVDVEHEPGDGEPTHRRRQQPSGLGGLHPGQLPRPSPRDPNPGQRSRVDAVQDAPGGGIRGHRPEQCRLVAQNGQVSDRLTTLGEHHRQVDSDPARAVARIALAQRRQRLAHRRRQASHIGQIDQHPSTRVVHHATPVCRNDQPRPQRSTLHLRVLLT